ncbi:unnamed protein product [Toxocara canis]|uniref:LEM domain-containing protein n=1 Tax=Toxocara canis TaxID=6265 RepID=A0A183UT70_TOXCA|nr:unnamed protein product [Toxocara canis]
MMNVDELSNDEIRERLIEFGMNVGPVLATTRIVYANKLKYLLEQKYGSGDARTDTGEPNGETQQSERLKTEIVGSFAMSFLRYMRYAILQERDLGPGEQAIQPVGNHPISKPVDSSSEDGSLQRVLPEQVREVIQDLHKCERDPSSDESDLCGEESSRLLTQEEIRRLNAPVMYMTDLRMASRTRMRASTRMGTGYHLQKHASVSTRDRCLIMTAVAVAAVFFFFVIRNLIALKNGDGNSGEL